MTAADVTFHRFVDQREIAAERDDVKISYYRRPKQVLAVVTNLGKARYEGTVRFEFRGLGLDDSAKATRLDEQTPKPYNTELRREALTLDKASLRMTIPGHDFVLIWVR